ncbi:hypothetical protein L1987_83714 [Smallanthus sonchifolius]|uniref:Uncharacterized protein n=1 Tax=Smallanthus sonchifolius TaxID=185202 RepID=A0ACB8YBX1_9ASTR|nr:hypothetical protein L1987_83714 [Smallanthus sonchifolius]
MSYTTNCYSVARHIGKRFHVTNNHSVKDTLMGLGGWERVDGVGIGCLYLSRKGKNIMNATSWWTICFYRSKFVHHRTLNSSTTHQTLDFTIAYFNFISSNPLFALLGSCRNLSSLKELHSLLIIDGHSSQLNLQTKLVGLYGSLGDMESARQCLRKCLKEHDNVVFSIVVKACTEMRDVNEGRKVHCHVVKAGTRDSFVLTSLVDMYAKCGDIKCSRRVFDNIVYDCCLFHGYGIKNGVGFNSHLVSSLVDMYMKCGAVVDARSVFDDLSSIDLVSWTAMIVGYSQNGYPNHAITLFTNKKYLDILPNSVAIASVISVCAQLGDSQLGSAIHCHEVKLGLEDGKVVNALVDMYAKCQMIKDARYLFDSFTNNDLITWNSIINGYAQTGCTYEVTTLLRFYAKCGELRTARRVFDFMGEKNIISWNALINAYGMQGYCSGSIEVFNNMFDFIPKMNHYACLVDLLARSGRLEEAFNLIENMQVQPDVSLLGSFLHGCSMHSRWKMESGFSNKGVDEAERFE